MKKNDENKEIKESKVKEEKVKKEKVKKEKTEKVKEPKVKEEKVKKEKTKNEKDVKFKEKISLNLRKKWLVNGSKTLLLVAILFLAYISLNLMITTLEIPDIDVTAGKIYTLSEDSKKAIEKVNKEVKIYVYGYEEDSQLMKFLKKYNKVNEKITCEVLTEESNIQKVQENDLKAGYGVLIFESGDAKKVVDASTEFMTTDYTTHQQLDTTEQAITNAILSLMVENKPKVYFTSGHQEMDLATEMTLLQTFLNNESFEMETINLVSKEQVPEDCDVLAIMSPSTDLYDSERDMILNYIAKGGKIYFTMDYFPQTIAIPNIDRILAEYGLTFENGQIFELAENSSVPTSPNVFKPQMSTLNPITSDIYTSKGEIWLAYVPRVKYTDEETLKTLNVTREDILNSSAESAFLSNEATSIEEAEKGKSLIATVATKKIATEDSKEVESKLLVCTNGLFISNYIVQALSANYPLSYIGNNKDLAINSIANLADKEGLTIRKEILAQATYIPTETEKAVVKTIIFVTPVIIVLAGFAVWTYRKKRK